MAKILALSYGLGQGEYELGYIKEGKASTVRFFTTGEELPTLWAMFCRHNGIDVASVTDLRPIV